MIIDRDGLYAFLTDFWPAMVKETMVSWSVHVSAGGHRGVAHIPVDADTSPSELTIVIAQMLELVEAPMVAFTSYAGDRARSSWCFFDPRRPVKLCELEIPGLVLPTLTNLREGWFELYERSKVHKGQADLYTNAALGRSSARPKVKAAMGETNAIGIPRGLLVRIIRKGRKLLDHDDNLPTSAKHVRDGVAKALGYDDGNPGISWHYDQHVLDRGDKPGVKIAIYERDKCPSCNQYTERKEAPF